MAATRTIVKYRSSPRARPKHRRHSKTVALAVVAGLMPMGIKAWQNYRATNDPKEIPAAVIASLTGYQMTDGKFDFKNLNYGLWPILGGFLVHKLAGKIGVNRAIGQAGIPWVRI